MFATFEEAHEGTGLIIGGMDNDLHRFLTDFYLKGRMENTAVFLTSDHGLHMGPYFETFPGKYCLVRETNIFCFVVLFGLTYWFS